MTDIEKAVSELNRKVGELKSLSKKERSRSLYILLPLLLAVIYYWGGDFFGVPDIKNKLTPKSNKINIIDHSERNILIRTDKGEVKLLNPSTHKVQDISLGNDQVRQAILSPDGQVVAYISDSPEGPALNFIKQSGEITHIFNAEDFNKQATLVFDSDSKAQICEWGRVLWQPAEQPTIVLGVHSSVSPNPTKVIFFACTKNESALFIVATTENGSKIKPIWRTKSNTSEPRQAVWLADGKIVLTSGDSIGMMFLVDPSLDEEPTQLYGSLNSHK